jgi:ferredoxin-type protein NapH
MRPIQKIGIGIFLTCITVFLITITLSQHKLTEEIVREKVGNPGAAEMFLAENSDLIDKEFGSSFSYIPALKAALHKTNDAVMKKYGFTDDEINKLISEATKDGKVNYRRELIDQMFDPSDEIQKGKGQGLKDQTGWIADKTGDYGSKEDFEKDLRPKIEDINKQMIAAHGFDDNNYTYAKFDLTKASSYGVVKDNLTLFFLICFVLASIGALMHIVPQINDGPPGIKNHGIFHHAAMTRGWIGIIAGTLLILFYVVLYWFPEYMVNWVLMVDPVSESLSGNPASQWFLYGFLYCVAMVVMGTRMFIKYRHNKYQMVRTGSVLFFQLGFAFLIPEILVRMEKPYMDLKNMWPLDYDFFDAYNIENLAGNSGSIGVFMLAWGISLFVIGVPLFTFLFGKRWYCSWVCGCGGLAETLGDPFRHLSDKSVKAWKIERWMIHSVLVFTVIMTIGLVYSFMHQNPDGYWITKNLFVYLVMAMLLGAALLFVFGKSFLTSMNKKIRYVAAGIGVVIAGLVYMTFSGGESQEIFFVESAGIRKTYGFMIGSAFAGVVGTGFYPLMGNRMWCRFGCPLAAYLGFVQRFSSRFRITTNGGQCISCGNCSTYCEMGIDVRWYAQRGQNIVRSSCVGCGICAAVCPRGVLKLENGPADNTTRLSEDPILIGNDGILILNPSIEKTTEEQYEPGQIA